ncbi:BCCT transporter [Deltaproteobacteria bacterium Smac51]|nr:BCCT transporter [Deltaproteobacteria bacterium Smac51]
MKDYVLRKGIFIPMLIIFTAVIILGLTDPSSFFKAETAISEFGYDYFGWLYILITLTSIAVLAWVFFSKKGDIIMGGPEAKPIYSYWKWFAVALCSIIGTGMVIWGIAEPVTFFHNPVTGIGGYGGKLEPMSQGAAVQGLGTSLLHWGIPSIALYTILTIGIGFACYNMRLPFRVSSMLYVVFGKRALGALGTFIDALCFFAIAVSVAAIMAVASTTIGTGISIFFGIESSTMLRGIILCVVLATFLLSSYTGLQRGIKWLSDWNAKIFVAMMIYAFIFGNPRFILSLSTEAMGAQLDMFFTRMTYLGTIDGDKFPMWWTVIYWIWMIVYGPMMGMFLAKIAQGRTFRQIIGVTMLPAFFIMGWFCIFGSSAISIELTRGAPINQAMADLGLEASVFAYFQQLPLSFVMGLCFIIVLYISVVTCCDGLASTCASMSVNSATGAEAEPPGYLKIFWGLVMASVSFLSILANATSPDGIDMLQAAKMLPMVGALPMLFVYVVSIYAIVKIFRNTDKYDVANNPETAIVEPDVMVK